MNNLDAKNQRLQQHTQKQFRQNLDSSQQQLKQFQLNRNSQDPEISFSQDGSQINLQNSYTGQHIDNIEQSKSISENELTSDSQMEIFKHNKTQQDNKNAIDLQQNTISNPYVKKSNEMLISEQDYKNKLLNNTKLAATVNTNSQQTIRSSQKNKSQKSIQLGMTDNFNYGQYKGKKCQLVIQKIEQEKKFVEENRQSMQQEDIQNSDFSEEEISEIRFRFKFLSIFFRILHRCESWRYKQLKYKHYRIINDNAIDADQMQDDEGDYIQQFQHNMDKVIEISQKILCCNLNFLDKIPIFKPENKISIFTTALSALAIFTMSLIYSFHIFFNYEFGEAYTIIRLIMFIIFGWDSLHSLNVGFYLKGSMILDRKKVFQNYFKTEFFFDIIGFYCLIYNQWDQSNTIMTYFFEFPFFLKLQQLRYKIENLEKIFVNSGSRSYLYKFLSLIFSIACTCHVLAILWNLLGIWQVDYLDEKHTWLHEEDALEAPWHEKYKHCFYWALATMMLIGSKGNNSLETWFAILTILLTVGVFAYTISEIANIIDDINKDSQQYKNELAIINKYMKQKNSSVEIQSKIRNYLEFLHLYSNFDTKNEVIPVLQKLPENLREELKKENNTSLLKQFHQLKHMFSQQTINNLCSVMDEKLFLTDETVFTQDQNIDISIYLIHKGKINLFVEREQEKIYENNQGANRKEQTLLKTCNKGDIFGTIGTEHKFTAQCIEPCTIYKITKADFERIIRENNEDQEKYKQIKDKLFLLKGIERLMNQKCMICDEHSHCEEKCPLVHFQPTPNSILRLNYFHPITKRNCILDDEQQIFQRSCGNLEQYFINAANHEIDTPQKENQYLIQVQQQLQKKKSKKKSITRFNNRLVPIQQSQNDTFASINQDSDRQDAIRNSISKKMLFKKTQTSTADKSQASINFKPQERVETIIQQEDRPISRENTIFTFQQFNVFIQKDSESQRYNTFQEVDDLNAFSLLFKMNLQQEKEHFMHNEVYQSKIYQQWLENFLKNDKINGSNDDENWYMIWLDKYLEEQLVYCDDQEEDIPYQDQNFIMGTPQMQQQQHNQGTLVQFDLDDLRNTSIGPASSIPNEGDNNMQQQGLNISHNINNNDSFSKSMILKQLKKNNTKLQVQQLQENSSISLPNTVQNSLKQCESFSDTLSSSSQSSTNSKKRNDDMNSLKSQYSKQSRKSQQQASQHKLFSKTLGGAMDTQNSDQDIIRKLINDQSQQQQMFLNQLFRQQQLQQMERQFQQDSSSKFQTHLNYKPFLQRMSDNSQINNSSQNNMRCKLQNFIDKLNDLGSKSKSSSYNQMIQKQLDLNNKGKIQSFLEQKQQKNKLLKNNNGSSRLIQQQKRGTLGKLNIVYQQSNEKQDNQTKIDANFNTYSSAHKQNIYTELLSDYLEQRVKPFSEKEQLFFDFDIYKNFDIYYQQFNFNQLLDTYKKIDQNSNNSNLNQPQAGTVNNLNATVNQNNSQSQSAAQKFQTSVINYSKIGNYKSKMKQRLQNQTIKSLKEIDKMQKKGKSKKSKRVSKESNKNNNSISGSKGI